MVSSAIGALGAVARAGIVVSARLRAVERFQALSRAIMGSDNRLVRFGRSAVIGAGQLAVFSTALRLLTHPITGLLALAGTALATKTWIEYTRAARRAGVQLELTGRSQSQISQRLRETSRILGVMSARDLFNTAKGFSAVSKLTDDWRVNLLELARKLDVLGVIDAPKFAELMAKALQGNLPAFKTLTEEVFPDLKGQVKDAAELFERLDAAYSDKNITNLERSRLEAQRLREDSSRIVGPIVNAMDGVNAALLIAQNNVTEFVLSLTRDFPVSIIQAGIKTVWDTIKAMPKITKEMIRQEWVQLKDTLGEIWSEALDDIDTQIGLWVTESAPEWLESLAKRLRQWLTNTWDPFWTDTVPTAVRKFFIETVPGLAVLAGTFIWSKFSEWARTTWSDFWNSEVLESVQDFVHGAGAKIGTFITETLPGFILTFAGTIGDFVSEKIISPIRDAINALIRLINENLIAYLNKIKIPEFIPGIGGYGVNIPYIPLVPGAPTRTGLAGQGAATTINFYVGDRKVDTVVLDSMTRIAKFRGGLNPMSMTQS